MSDIEPVRFNGSVRYWDPAKASGLAVVDVPGELVQRLGGLRQQRVSGRIGGQPFTSTVMPAGGGRLALSVSKQMLKTARIGIGDAAEVEISTVGSD